MIIEIASDIFSNNENLRDVNYLISLFSDNNRYGYFCDISRIGDSELFKSLLDIDKLVIEQNFNKYISESAKSDFLIESTNTSSSFSIEEAKRYFNQSFVIILENSLNDSYFLKALVNNFKKRGKIIRRHLEKGWIDYGNGGGLENIINELNSMMMRFETLPKSNHQYLRCFVLVDSDKKSPLAQTENSRKKLFEFLNKINVPFHELEKREMEIYLPDEVVDTIQDDKVFIEAYLRLSPVQKDYFDLENGFARNLSSLTQDVQVLYESVSVADYSVLRSNKIQLTPNFKSEFPKLFLHKLVTQDTLKRRVSHQIKDPNELESILDKISSLL